MNLTTGQDTIWHDGYSPDLIDADFQKQQVLAQQAQTQRKIGLIPEAIGAIGDTLATANQAYGVHAPANAMEDISKGIESNIAKKKTDLESTIETDPNSDSSKQYQTLLGQFTNKDPKLFAQMSAAQIRDQIPAIEKLAGMQNQKDLKNIQIQSLNDRRNQSEKDRAVVKAANESDKATKRQEDLEKQAQDRMLQVRGDRSIQNIETQRDAAITAYNRLDEIQKSGQPLNPVDYTDILGQIYKARTGSAPTNTVLKNIEQSTAKGDFGHAYTYITGQQAPATTQDIAKSLQAMSMSMGQQADKLHEGYMSSRLSLPKDLEPSRADRISKLARGTSFADAIGQNNNSIPAVGGTYQGGKVLKVTRIK